jgi:leucyl-tRNA synthetase
MRYNPNEIESYWQKYWAENQTFAADNKSDKPKYYVLDMFPYPSGAGLHVGHPLGYIASDIYARYKRHQGFNVLHPQGYDSFGLPAEQYAIQTGQHPDKTTKENIARYRSQLDKIGFSFDWSREVRTSDPEYYKWTQWIFIELFNSWYNKISDKAESICSLIAEFEANGNADVKAVCDDNIDIFSDEDWKGYSNQQQQEILLKYRLTYLAETEVNWCPGLGTVLANDEIINGVSERGGFPVIRKKMTQWSMRISAYAQRLLDGLQTIDWTQSLKDSQENWIGKSVGALVTFKIKSEQDQLDYLLSGDDTTHHKIEVFTTRPDTIFGVTFVTLAPEHELVSKITIPTQKRVVQEYIEATAKRSERERMADVKTISGVFTGAYAEHPFTKEPIPVWIGDYVLAGYGTGAVMAVPAGDERDHAFANHFKGLEGMPEIRNIFEGVDIQAAAYTAKDNTPLANSEFLNGLGYKEAMKTVIKALEEIGLGKGKTNYRLRDAVFSRQRYWGEPFPVYYIDGLPQMIDPKYLPIRLPEVEKYLPTEDGQPPLGNATHWHWDTQTNTVVGNDKANAAEGVYPLELNTMPGWAGSSWYWIRYMDAGNQDAFVSKEAEAYWQNVDLYIGGSEHATGHLLYSRFWNKFLKDRGHIQQDEPFKKLINQGMILGMSAFAHRIAGTNKYVSKGKAGQYSVQDIHVDVNMVNSSDELDINAFKAWREDFAEAEFILEDNGRFIVSREVEKMSKSKYNVVTPDDICAEYGADTLRLYEMFLGPLEQAKPWNTAGITGVFGFLKKLWKLYFDDKGLIVNSNPASKEALKTLHKTIKKVQDDIEGFSFNTSVSQFMICVNELTAMNCHERSILEPLAVVISPYAPHIAEELWKQLGHEGSISTVPFPRFNPEHLVESSKEYPVSFNGKMRFTIELPLDLSTDEIQDIIMADERTIKQLEGRTPNKVIIVPGKIINIVG